MQKKQHKKRLSKTFDPQAIEIFSFSKKEKKKIERISRT
jgi:hypothetical protein